MTLNVLDSQWKCFIHFSKSVSVKHRSSSIQDAHVHQTATFLILTRNSDYVHQFELSFLSDWQDVDEGLVEDSSFWQLGNDLGDLLSAWQWDVDLLGEPDIAILQGEESLIGSHSNLQGRRISTIEKCRFKTEFT